MAEIMMNNPRLWQETVVGVQNKHPELTHDSWDFRLLAINSYYQYGGRFTNTRPALPDERYTPHTTSLIKNALALRKLPITSSLMARSLTYQWREYLSHQTVKINLPNQQTGIIQRGGFFGIIATTGGYSIMLPDASNTVAVVPHLVGYALLTLSRELTRRETKFRD